MRAQAKSITILLLLIFSNYSIQQTVSNKFADICYAPRTFGVGADPTTYEGSLIADFPDRETFLAQYLKIAVYRGNSWGIKPPKFSEPTIPSLAVDPVKWKRDRVVAVAKSYVGFPYRHHYIPTWYSEADGCGVDCSNFTGWIYNYGLGISFTTAVDSQARGIDAPGRILEKNEPLLPGDLIFMRSSNGITFSHAAMFVEEDTVIDSTGLSIGLRRMKGFWYSRYEMARRIIE